MYNMDNTNSHVSVVSQHTFINHTGNMTVPSSVAYESTQSGCAGFRTFCNDYDCRPDGFMRDSPATSHSGWDFGGHYSSSQFVCQPPGHFSNTVPPALANTSNDRDLYSYQTYSPQYRSGIQCAPFSSQRHCFEAPANTENDAAVQRKRDVQWVECFSRNTKNPTNVPQKRKNFKSDLKPVLYRAARLVTQLHNFCNTLGTKVSDSKLWTDFYTQALHTKKEVEDAFSIIDCGDFGAWKRRLHRNAERRTRKLQKDAEKRRQEDISKKEAVIDAWRLRHIRGVEEKKKVKRLKSKYCMFIFTHTFTVMCIYNICDLYIKINYQSNIWTHLSHLMVVNFHDYLHCRLSLKASEL